MAAALLGAWGDGRSRADDDEEPEAEDEQRDDHAGAEDALERAALLADARGPPHELPRVVHASRDRQREEQRGKTAEEDRADPRGHEAGPVLHVAADPQPERGLGPEQAEAEHELDR